MPFRKVDTLQYMYREIQNYVLVYNVLLFCSAYDLLEKLHEGVADDDFDDEEPDHIEVSHSVSSKKDVHLLSLSSWHELSQCW